MSRFKYVVLFCTLLLLTACFRQSPGLVTTPEETPAITDTHLSNASKDEGQSTTLDGTVDDSTGVVFDDPELEVDAPPVTDVSSQAVLPGGQGYVVYAWNNSANATQPWRIYRHNAVTDATTLIYGGLRQVDSVTISGDGTKILAAIRETDSASSDYEIYQINLSTFTVTQLTNNNGADTNVSMTDNAGKYVWEGDGASAGIRNIFIRDNLVTPVTTTALAPSISSEQPSITGNGRFIALLRKNTAGDQLIYRYELSSNVYTLLYTSPIASQSTRTITHPSLSNEGHRVAFAEKALTVAGLTKYRIYVRNTLNPTDPAFFKPILNTDTLNAHPHITADGTYLTYSAQTQAGGKFAVLIRNLTNSTQATVALDATADMSAPYWQQPGPPAPPPDFDPNNLAIRGGAGNLPIAFGKGAFTFDATAFEGTNFQWSFGDGTTASDIAVSKSYDKPGLYTVTLSFTDSGGTARTIANQVAVNPEIHEMAETRNLKDSDVIKLDAGPTLPGLTYQWKIDGGGTSTTIDGPKGSSSQLTKLGSYTYTLSITDTRTPALREGELGAQALSVPYITPEGYVEFWRKRPVAVIKTTTTTVSEVPFGNAPFDVRFDASSSTAATNVTYTWDFGDGTTGEGATASRTYTKEGRYLVTLTIKDKYEQEDKAQTFVFVKNANFRATFNMAYPAPTAIAAQQINKYLEDQELAELSTLTAANGDFGVELQSEALRSAEVQALNEFTPQAEVSVYPYYFPYVVHNVALLNGTVDPLNLKFWSQEPLGQTLPYFNGSEIPEININTGTSPRSTWTYSFQNCDRGNRVGLCDAMFFFVNGAAFPKPLPSNRLNDVSVITALNNGNGFILGHEFNAFANLRVPKIYIAVVPDETLSGEQMSPFVTENTVDINGKKELIAQILIRESEAIGFLEFDLPVYAVDVNGKLAQHANGFFKARVPNIESYVQDGVMVKGKAYIHMKLSIGFYVDGGAPIDLSKIEVFHSDTCASSTVFTLNEQSERVNGIVTAKTSLASVNGCSRVTTSNEAPTGVTEIEPYDYTLTQAALVGVNRVVYGRTPAERKTISERLKDVPRAIGLIIWNGLPFLSDTTDLLKFSYDTAIGQGADPILASIAAGGLILDATTGGLGDVTVGIKILYKESKRVGGFFAESITDTIVKAIADGKPPTVMFGELTTLLGDITKLFLNGGIGAIKSADSLAKKLTNLPCPVALNAGEITSQGLCDSTTINTIVSGISSKALAGKVSPFTLIDALEQACCEINGAENLVKKVLSVTSDDPSVAGFLQGVISNARAAVNLKNLGFQNIVIPEKDAFKGITNINGKLVDTEPDLRVPWPNLPNGATERIFEVKTSGIPDEAQIILLLGMANSTTPPRIPSIMSGRYTNPQLQALKGLGIQAFDLSGKLIQ